MIRLVLGVVLGAVAGWLARSLTTVEPPPPPGPPPGPVLRPSASAPAPPAPDVLEAERDELVDACVWAFESSPSRAVQRRMRDVLQGVGVELLAPADVPFDPAVHERVGTEDAAPPAVSGTVARTLRAGVQDRERLVRPAQVVVRTAEPPDRGDVLDADRP